MISQDHVQELAGATAYDRDGDKIGRVGQIYYDDNTDQPKWVTVHTGFFGTSESFAPLEGASFDRGAGSLTVAYDKARVKDAPNLAEGGHLSADEEERLYRHYGLDGGTGYDTGHETGHQTGHDTGYDTGYGTAGVAGAVDTNERGTRGHDTSGPTTDQAMTRSEERLNVGTQTHEAGRARLRKHVVTEHQQVTVPVSREEVTLEREPITDANAGAAYDGPAISEEEHEVTLREERPVVETEAVPVERVRLGTETVTEQETVGGEVRREEIELDTDERRSAETRRR